MPSMRDVTLGIVGGGTVGRATARAFVEHVREVRVHDTLPERRTHGLVDTLDTDLVFVCLPEGEVDAFLNLHDGYRRNFVLKSTVPIGTTRELARKYGLPNLVHSPEFLTASCSVTDAQLPARNVIGVPDAGAGATLDVGIHCAQVLSALYRRRFPGVPVLLMSSDESEAVKLYCNAFFAVKVSLFNEFHDLARTLGLDWGRVLAGVLSDGRISHSHTQVPGRDGFGFGGACLPKDLAMLIDCAGMMNAVICKAAADRNRYDRGRTA